MSDHAREVKALLTDAAALCGQLGWLEGAKRQARGVVIRCPAHGERNPSCSVTSGPDGTLRVKCFGCEWSGDALTMIALAHGLRLNTSEGFRDALALGAQLGGHLSLADEIRAGRAAPDRRPVPAPAPVPETEYPDAAELAAFWGSLDRRVGADPEVAGMLMRRRIDPATVSDLSIARVLPARHGVFGERTPSDACPAWAAYRGRFWGSTGHRLILPVFDDRGAMRSVRAWRVTDGDTPKRLPPAGKKAAGLVLANRPAQAMLGGGLCPLRLFIVEGEPDFAVAATDFPGDAVIGVGSGLWTAGHASRIPVGTRVIIATHPDDAGDRYAAQILATLDERRDIRRGRPAA